MLTSLLYASLAMVGFAADDAPSDLCVGDPALKLEVAEVLKATAHQANEAIEKTRDAEKARDATNEQ